ncbi:hypothetical protein HDU67_001859 [Dinochytrium kinnereticum]|nr:hypothetical protein HDU67_001859 [Dinochytrium kinnereticum]
MAARISLVLLLVSSMFVAHVLANNGEGTFYYPDGAPGSCGRVFRSSDFVAAPAPGHYGGGASCWRCARCPYCSGGDMDLSPSAFRQLASESVGRIQMQWQWTDCGNRWSASARQGQLDSVVEKQINSTLQEEGRHNKTTTGEPQIVEATVAIMNLADYDRSHHSGTPKVGTALVGAGLASLLAILAMLGN